MRITNLFKQYVFADNSIKVEIKILFSEKLYKNTEKTYNIIMR